MKTIFLALFLILACAKPVSATIVTIDFEQFSGGDYTGNLLSQGFVIDPGAVGTTPFWAGHYHIAESTQTFWFSNNGTKYMIFDYFFDRTQLNIYGTSGEIFGVRQLDLGEATRGAGPTLGDCSSYSLPYHVKFTGYLADGGTITRDEPLDMICDGLGPQNDFETFTFTGEWNRLTMLTVQQLTLSDTPESWVGIDNIVLRTVPEPSTLLLFVTGAGLIWLTLRRRPLGATKLN